MKKNLLTKALALLLAGAGYARADVVLDWNAVLDTVAPRFRAPQPQARAHAMAHSAVHDALNTVVPRDKPSANLTPADPNASPEAAVATAASQVMLALLGSVPDSPAKQAAIDAINAAYDTTVGPAPYDAATQAG